MARRGGRLDIGSFRREFDFENALILLDNLASFGIFRD
jgi:hypothetical protein